MTIRPVRKTAPVIDTPRIALFAPSFESGGVERMLVNLACGFSDLGVAVDFVIKHAEEPYIDLLPWDVRLVPLGRVDGKALIQSATDYLRHERPAVLLSSKAENDRLAVTARGLAQADLVHAIRVPVHVSNQLAMKGHNRLRQWLTKRELRRLFRSADRLIAVSRGVADDTAAIAHLPPERVSVIPNPVITPQLAERAQETVDHPWFADRSLPLVLGMGRLGRQKNFALLIEAFARLRAERPARLVILGEGRYRARLEAQAAALGVADDVALPGFTANPYPWLARANLFVLSSDWEGSPNALTEALALGVPSVATDCRSGPREILAGGRYGPLVPPGDAVELAAAMARLLAAPPDPRLLREAVTEYTQAASAERYLAALGFHARRERS
ncbi:MAG: glycosyltransferase [Chromatiales bacterium]|nr:glycosyltransferase [Chromatiales bacterium]MDX9765992.1 glycosyltransferase [Ectothiorhodospiraceae bacterium]